MPIFAQNAMIEYEGSYDNCVRSNSHKELFSFMEGGAMPRLLEMPRLSEKILSPPNTDPFSINSLEI